jgi:chromosome segregation ATPase
MTGGTRIIAFDSASASAPGDEFLLTEELSATVADTSPEEAPQEDDPPVAAQARWLLPAIGGVLLVLWTAFFIWAMFDRMISDPLPEQWVELLGDWAVPVLLVVVAALVLLRNSRREALRFGDAARLLSDESARLDTRLSVVNRELSLAREFIAAQSRDLETLGRLAADRLSTQADRLQGLIRENHARVETIGSVSEAALDNMEKLRGQLPVIASSAKDVTNNIGNAGRTAHSQLQEMVAGFRRLNEFGQASERQVHVLRGLVEETIAEFGRQADQFTNTADVRFAAFQEAGAAFRAQMDTHEVEALAAIRSRASAMAEEIDQTRQRLDRDEAESLTSLRARLSALREEGNAIARALRDGESRAVEAWQAGVARMKEDLQEALVAIREADAETASASHARVGAIAQDLARLEKQAAEQAHQFAEAVSEGQAEAFAAQQAGLARMNEILTAIDEAVAARRAQHGEIDQEAAARLREQLATHDREIAERRSRHEQLERLAAEGLRARLSVLDAEMADRRIEHEAIEQQSAERMREQFAAIDGEISHRRVQHEAQSAAIADHADKIAARLAEFEKRATEIAAHGSHAEATLAASLGALASGLAAGRSALAGTEGEIAALTDSSVRLLELIQASARHGAEDLPQALSRGEVQLRDIEARMAALREAAGDTQSRGAQLAQTVDSANDTLRQTYAELSALQAGLDRSSSAHGEVLAHLRGELDAITNQSAALAEDTRTRLAAALDELSRSTRAAVDGFSESGSAAVAALARQAGSETAIAIDEAMRSSTLATTGKLERAVAEAATVSREAAMQLRDQLAKVNELTGNLESRVAHARQRAEEQVDNDFTRRVALITESLNSNAIDIAKALSTDVSDTAWAAYLRGDRGIFTRRAVSLVDNAEAKMIAQTYERDRDFHEHVSRYIHDFEAMLRQVLSARDGQALGVTLLSSDMGKLYVALAQAIQRLRS